MHPEAEKFLIRVKRAICAGEEGKTGSSLPGSRSWKYADGEFDYMDSCSGTEQFTRQEVLWEKKTPIWAANYVGRILGKDFPADFFREALLAGAASRTGEQNSMKRGAGFINAPPRGTRIGSMDTKKFSTGICLCMNALSLADSSDKSGH